MRASQQPTDALSVLCDRAIAGERRDDRGEDARALAEVAKAAVALDRVEHMGLTTGTPTADDRGAALLASAVLSVEPEHVEQVRERFARVSVTTAAVGTVEATRTLDVA